jgi:hypothetical protein
VQLNGPSGNQIGDLGAMIGGSILELSWLGAFFYFENFCGCTKKANGSMRLAM